MPIPTLYEVRMTNNNNKKVKSLPMAGKLQQHMFKDVYCVRPVVKKTIAPDALVVSADRRD